jgi:hypothetical protein
MHFVSVFYSCFVVAIIIFIFIFFNLRTKVCTFGNFVFSCDFHISIINFDVIQGIFFWGSIIGK